MSTTEEKAEGGPMASRPPTALKPSEDPRAVEPDGAAEGDGSPQALGVRLMDRDAVEVGGDRLPRPSLL